MKKNEIKSTTQLTEFQKRCLFERCGDDHSEIFVKHWEDAKDFNEFLALCLKDESLAKTQAIAELFKDDWYYLRSQLGDKSRKTNSEAGSLKIGVKGLSILIPNGHGDGTTRYGIFENNEINFNAFTYFTIIEGEEIIIYTCDYGNEVAEVISGKFLIYYNNGFVVFEKSIMNN